MENQEDRYFEDIFSTEIGVRFGGQVDHIFEFVFKGQMLTFLKPIGILAHEILQGMQKGLFSKAFDQLEVKPLSEETAVIKDMERFSGHIDLSDMQEGFDSLPSGEDTLWYISLNTIAIYSYLDLYTKKLIDFIARKQ